MADLTTVDNGALADYTVLTDEVTDGILGTGQKQYVAIMDGTINGTTKAAVGANGLKVDASGATVPISGTVSVSGTVATQAVRASTSSLSNASVTNVNGTILASNANRLGATIYNDSTVSALVKLGATASTTSFTVKLYQDSYYEVPAGYTGIIDAITASGTATLRVTELT